MIGIVDYGAGNLRSVEKALKLVGLEGRITSNPDEILKSKGVILPGVGAFYRAMERLRELKLDTALREYAASGRPLLGICLGMQILFDEGDEVKRTEGLGFIKGRVKKFDVDLKIPHMGWNSIKIQRDCKILKGVKDESFVYFVHSYHGQASEEKEIYASTDYGISFPSVVGCKNVFGVQFHPEKSGDTGLLMLKNFGELIK